MALKKRGQGTTIEEASRVIGEEIFIGTEINNMIIHLVEGTLKTEIMTVENLINIGEVQGGISETPVRKDLNPDQEKNQYQIFHSFST